MKDKLISGIIGAIIGGLIVFGYSNFFTSNQNTGNMGPGKEGGAGMNMDVSTMSEQQLETMAERAGISVDELKQRVESGESIRDIIPRGDNNGERPSRGSND